MIAEGEFESGCGHSCRAADDSDLRTRAPSIFLPLINLRGSRRALL